MDATKTRIVRSPLPVDLLRQMDRLILSGTGGFETRAEFIRESIEAMVLELSFPDAGEEPKPKDGNTAQEDATRSPKGHQASARKNGDEHLAFTIEDTKLSEIPSGYSLKSGVAKADDEPIYGLHNRDYPSLWAAHQIAMMTCDGPIQGAELWSAITTAAWDYSRQLVILEKSLDRKLTALFPTNDRKPQTASAGFRDFAIGKFHRSGKSIISTGPLFQWNVCQIGYSDDTLVAGITPVGFELLRSVAGISLDLPHPQSTAKSFFSHLQMYAPMDWWGFETVLFAASEGANRASLSDRFQSYHPEWGSKKAASYAAGYVSRCREWGLLKPKQEAAAYKLTEFGIEHLQKANK